MAARIAIPLTYVGRQVGASVHHDVAPPTLALPHVIKDGYAAMATIIIELGNTSRMMVSFA
jgi:hypothetical protein